MADPEDRFVMGLGLEGTDATRSVEYSQPSWAGLQRGSWSRSLLCRGEWQKEVLLPLGLEEVWRDMPCPVQSEGHKPLAFPTR